MRWTILAGVFVLMLAVQARAQTPLDTVLLQNGGVIRGTVLEYEPGGDVVIRSATGTLRTIPANEVGEVRIAGAVPPSSAPVEEPSRPDRPDADAAPEPSESDAMRDESAAPPEISTVVPSPPPRAPSAARRWAEPRDLSDGDGNAPAWNNPSVRRSEPRGEFHFGVQASGGLMFLTAGGYLNGRGGSYGPSTFFSGEADAFVDIFPTRALAHVRIQLGVHFGPGAYSCDPAGCSQNALTAGPRLRVLAGIDATEIFTLRIGPYGALEVLGDIGLAAAFGLSTEYVFRFLTERTLEVGLATDTGVLVWPIIGSSFDHRLRLMLAYVF